MCTGSAPARSATPKDLPCAPRRFSPCSASSRSPAMARWSRRSRHRRSRSSTPLMAPRPPFGAAEIPFELIAIVNRPDLRLVPDIDDAQTGAAAQGRFIFSLVDAQRNPLPFTAIFEYMVPVSGLSDLKGVRIGANGWASSKAVAAPCRAIGRAARCALRGAARGRLRAGPWRSKARRGHSCSPSDRRWTGDAKGLSPSRERQPRLSFDRVPGAIHVAVPGAAERPH